jgi:RNA polymerase sigma-70 factor (ECF subfamily)
VREHTALVWRTAYRLLANRDDAADCYQETFVAAWELARRRPVRNWPGLLQRVATTRALDHLRRRRRAGRRRESVPDLAEIRSDRGGPLADAENAELSDCLRRALADLPERQSQAYCLRHLNGFSYEQIADELDMTVSAVGVNLQRAGQRLRAALAPTVLASGRERGNP